SLLSFGTVLSTGQTLLRYLRSRAGARADLRGVCEDPARACAPHLRIPRSRCGFRSKAGSTQSQRVALSRARIILARRIDAAVPWQRAAVGSSAESRTRLVMDVTRAKSLPHGRGSDGQVPYLNVGCGKHFHPAWTNLDLQARPRVIQHDLRTRLPFPEGRFEAVYHSHVLEHLPRADGLRLLQECARVLRP